jgi:Na+-driven multidrug efflux pump
MKFKIHELYIFCVQLLPKLTTTFIELSPWITDVTMLGHNGKGNLASGCIAMAYFHFVWIFINGVITSQDALSNLIQGHGSSKLTYGMEKWLNVIICVTTVLCLIGSFILMLSPFIIHLLSPENNHVANKAVIYLIISIPTLWLMALFRVFQKYLQAYRIVVFPFGCNILGFIINISGMCSNILHL